jgi:hypothetical protein
VVAPPPPVYQHHDIGQCFADLWQEIKRFLGEFEEPEGEILELEPVENGFEGPFKTEWRDRPLYLIAMGDPRDQVSDWTEGAIIGSPGSYASYWRIAFRGLDRALVADPPGPIKDQAQDGWVFRLESIGKAGDVLEKMAKEGRIAVKRGRYSREKYPSQDPAKPRHLVLLIPE